MKRSILLSALCIVLRLPVVSQSNVDRLSHALDSLSSVAYNDWKVSPDLRRGVAGDPTSSGFDDSKWDNLRLGQSIYPDSCWIRKEIVLPDRILGKKVGGPVKFLVSVDDYGFLWVNGEKRGYFPWDGEFELTKDAQPGQKFLISIKAINTGGPLRLIRAEIESEISKPVRQTVKDLALSLTVGQKLLSFDTYQKNAHKKTDPKIDKSTQAREEKTRLANELQALPPLIDLDALASGNIDRFSASVQNVRSRLKPIGVFARQFTLFFDANAHIDAAWLWRDLETKEVCNATFTSVLNMMDARKDFTYTQSAAAYYNWMEQLHPEVFKRMQARVKEGRWEVVGGMWVEPDCNLPAGESWMRHLLYSKRYFKAKLGTDVTIGYNPDSFGYNWNMPQFYRNAGIDAFITQKMGWSEHNVFPYHLFWWEAPDGSRVLNYFPFDYVNAVDDPNTTIDQLRQFEANSGFRKMLILFGVGDHGGGPSNEMLDRIEHLKSLDVFPAIEYGTAAQYLNWLRSNDLSGLPVWKDELYLEYHQGCYTTQAKTKEWNRRSEVLLTNTEKFGTIASMYGKQYESANLEEAWRNVLFNQFHDILPGSGIRENYIDAAEKYTASEAIARFDLKESLERVAQLVNTSKIQKGTPLVVWNALAWERTSPVVVQLPEGDRSPYSVFDLRGNEVPSHTIEKDRIRRELVFLARRVPSLGYETFELRRQKASAAPNHLSVSRSAIENEYFRIAIDTGSGWIRSITDKRNGRELLRGAGNELQLLEDRPRQWDAWNVGLTGTQYPSTLRSIEVIEQNPVRAVVRGTRDFLKPGIKKDLPTPDYPSSFFTQDIILYEGIDQIYFQTNADWWEDKTMIKVAFPLTVSDSAASYEIPFSSIRRSTQWTNSWDSAKVEVPAQRWADLSQDDYGVSLLNRAKYGYDIKGSTMRLSLLRSPQWPDPTADRGKQTIEYALYPHKGRWRQANTVRAGYEYNNSLIGVMTARHPGKLPPAHAFVRLEPGNCVLTTLKKAEDSDAWIVQWYDATGDAGEATLTLPATPKSVVHSNFLEEDGTTIPFQDNVVKVPTGRNSVVTVKVRY